MSKPLIEVLGDAEAVAPEVAEAAYRKDRADRDLTIAIREARTRGLSLRAIAAAAGMSHESVRKIAG